DPSFGLHENIASEEDSVHMKSESTVSYLRERNPSISEESIDDFCVQSKPTVKCEEDKLEIPAFLRRQSH
ncbi:cell division protein FtsZ, partial [Candidatus Liberibacter asiaticus]